jgi:hypothetical protein
VEAIMSVEPERRYEPAYFLDQIAEYMARGMSPERARAEAARRYPQRQLPLDKRFSRNERSAGIN